MWYELDCIFRNLNLISVDPLENLFDGEVPKIPISVERSESIRYFDRSRRAKDSLRKLFHDSIRLRYVQSLHQNRESILSDTILSDQFDKNKY